MWQYSWKGNINGISGDVDEDYCYVNYPEQIKARGLNGFGVSNPNAPEEQEPVSKEPTAPVEPSDDTDSDLDIEVAIGGVKYKGKVKKV
jgi:GH25 family lysozyme M1 (1,4-beta-N-acetylmuramidase)